MTRFARTLFECPDSKSTHRVATDLPTARYGGLTLVSFRRQRRDGSTRRRGGTRQGGEVRTLLARRGSVCACRGGLCAGVRPADSWSAVVDACSCGGRDRWGAPAAV